MRCCAASEQLSRSQKTNKNCDRENCIMINFVTCTHHHVTAVIKPRKIRTTSETHTTQEKYGKFTQKFCRKTWREGNTWKTQYEGE